MTRTRVAAASGTAFGLLQSPNVRAVTTVAAVPSLTLRSVPVVVVAAPPAAGRHVEHVTGRLRAGAALVVAGSLLLIAVA